MKQLFAFYFLKNSTNDTMQGDMALTLYCKLVLNNPAFEGPLSKRFFMYLKSNRELGSLTQDEWENIPLFLIENALGLHEYKEQSGLPPMFDEFVQALSFTVSQIVE